LGAARRFPPGIEIDTLGRGDRSVTTLGTFTRGPTVTPLGGLGGLGGAGLRTDTLGTGLGSGTRSETVADLTGTAGAAGAAAPTAAVVPIRAAAARSNGARLTPTLTPHR
jgi:hypothetical protein